MCEPDDSDDSARPMLKFIFWSLLLANIGLFAYQQGYLNAWIPDGHEPARAEHQFHPELMKVVAANDVALAPASEASKSTTTSSASDSATPVGKAEALVCKDVGNFDGASAKRFETMLQPLGLGDKLTRKDSEEVANNIVYIPSQGSKEAADKKAGELRHLGVNDFYVIQDAGDLHWGISLGVFKTEEAARAFLSSLNQKGVHSARLGTHTIASTKVTFQLTGLDGAMVAGVDKIVADFPHVEVHACDGTPSADVKTAASHAAAKSNIPREVTH
jgi:hypothetical protein